MQQTTAGGEFQAQGERARPGSAMTDGAGREEQGAEAQPALHQTPPQLGLLQKAAAGLQAHRRYKGPRRIPNDNVS